jgi:hypothetical protein
MSIWKQAIAANIVYYTNMSLDKPIKPRKISSALSAEIQIEFLQNTRSDQVARFVDENPRA